MFNVIIVLTRLVVKLTESYRPIVTLLRGVRAVSGKSPFAVWLRLAITLLCGPTITNDAEY